MIVIAKFLTFVLGKIYNIQEQTINFTKFEKFLYTIYLKFRLSFYFYRGYAIGCLFYSKLLGQTSEYEKVTKELVKSFKLKDSDCEPSEQLSNIVLGVGGLDFNWYIRFFQGFLYFCSQVSKLNYVCTLEGKILNQIHSQGGEVALNLEYKYILEKCGSKLGVLISVYDFDNYNNVLGHNELMLVHRNHEHLELENFSIIGEKGIQNIVKIFEKYRNLFDNDVERFTEALKAYSRKTQTSEQLRIGLRNNWTCIALCAILESGKLVIIPIYV